MTDLGEPLQNSMAVDSRGLYVLTYEALYRVSVADEGSVRVDWRAPYDPGTSDRGISPGSGSTPTLLGVDDDLIAIADNADEQINLLVLDRESGTTVCEVPLFRPGESGTENSVVGYGDDVVIANNGGFGGVLVPARIVDPGLERHRVRLDRSGCDLVWRNDDSIANSAQLSTATGLIYGYGADPELDVDAFHLVAHDWETGQEVFRVYAGDGQLFDPVLGQPHLHPEGQVLIGAMGGVILFRDGQ